MGTVVRTHRGLRLLLAGVLVVLGMVGSAAVYVERTILAPIDRIDDVFTGLPDRPPVIRNGSGTPAVNILLLGTDRRSDVPTTGAQAQTSAWRMGAQRSDAMLLVHISADRADVSIISLPRDSWVEVPGHGSAKINAAYSWGGPRLAVATVEKLTRVRIDHLAVIDWDGLRRLTDALGGVTVEVPETVHDSIRDITWTAGEHHLDGQGVLDYVAQRYGLPGGDLDRARRQQNVLRIVLQDTLAHLADNGPFEVYDLIRVLAENVSVDSDWGTTEMVRLAWSLRNVEDSGIRFLTAPLAGLGREGTQSVVHLDPVRGHALWEAVRRDAVPAWVRRNADTELTDEVR